MNCTTLYVRNETDKAAQRFYNEEALRFISYYCILCENLCFEHYQLLKVMGCASILLQDYMKPFLSSGGCVTISILPRLYMLKIMYLLSERSHQRNYTLNHAMRPTCLARSEGH